jgi:hypothetical protein
MFLERELGQHQALSDAEIFSVGQKFVGALPVFNSLAGFLIMHKTREQNFKASGT